MPSASHSSYDLAVAGGGIFGLSVAYAALRKGLSVVVIERDHIGAGASGGLLGALMPHMPARWNPKKNFQLEALTRLQDHVAGLEADTGLSTGYKRLGRLLPITTQDKLEHHLERAEESLIHWQPQTTGFTYEVEPVGSRADWLDAAAAPFGVVHETLAGRISPRAYLRALEAYIAAKGQIMTGATVSGRDAATGRLRFASGEPSGGLSAERLVIATGFEGFALLDGLTGEKIGRGEKGQAILLDGQGLEELPAIYCDGLYVVPHDDGTVAVGSTSERHVETREVDPATSKTLYETACGFCPSLKGRDILSEWAGVRPRCNKRDPLAGALPGHPGIYVATGGFKISFGIAHLIAHTLIAEIVGDDPQVALPDTFRPAHHFKQVATA